MKQRLAELGINVFAHKIKAETIEDDFLTTKSPEQRQSHKESVEKSNEHTNNENQEKDENDSTDSFSKDITITGNNADNSQSWPEHETVNKN